MNEAGAETMSPSAGLCARCSHAQAVRSARGSMFVLCGRSKIDPRFPKYPALPVMRCAGYEQHPSASE